MNGASIRWRILGISVLCSLALTSRADLLDFNSPPVTTQDPHGARQPYVEDGFRFQVGSGSGTGASIIRFNPLSAPGALPNDGTPYFGATYFAIPHMDRMDGGFFSISQIDLSCYSVYAQTSSLTVQGNMADGSFVTTTFGLPGWDGLFHRYNFSSQWTNLQSVDFVSGPVAWDNIVVSPVPEPPTFLLTGAGVLTLYAFRKRRRT